ncbi:MAG: SPOR domain-containing protein [Burkholderiales bacterium]|nr:SPOR domain-containing protein [Burkholderiales bacterium]
MAKRKSSDNGALDPALTQKKRARRRLVGAMALGVLAAIVLPLLLDSEPRQTISDVQVEIPPRDAPAPPTAAQPPAVPPLAAEAPAEGKAEAGSKSATVPPVPPVPATGSSSGASSAASAPRESSAPAAASKAAPPAGSSSSSSGASSPARRSDSAAAQRDNPPRREAPPRETPTPPREPARSADSKPRPAEAKPAAEAKPESTRFVLQLGAYANPASAKAQADKASKAGVRAYTETVQTTQGARTRVRVGPFNSREAAEQSRAKLKNGGIDASVVSL